MKRIGKKKHDLEISVYYYIFCNIYVYFKNQNKLR